MVLAMAAGLGLFYFLTKKKNIKPDDVYDLAFWLMLGGIIGARLYDVLFVDWAYYRENLLAIYKIWEGGLAIHGAIIGGAVALIVWSRKKKISPWLLADLLVAPLALGQAIGRWGNYFNQELFGRPTGLPWGVPIDEINRPAGFGDHLYFHPTFLYESILNLVLFAGLILVGRKNFGRGTATTIYLFGYGVIRFVLEFVRIDETPLIWGLRLPQWVSLGLIIGSVVAWIMMRRQKQKSI